MPLPLSVAIVCRNSEATVGRTLDSVSGLAAEIIALDSGSTDGTITLLECAGAKVSRVEWRGYVATKQAALDACTQPWVLSLDSDESLTPPLRASIERALAGDPAPDGFEVNRKVYYRDRPLNFAWQPERRLRLVRRGRARWTGLDPHDHLEIIPVPPRSALRSRCDETPAPPGTEVPERTSVARVARLDGDLRHDSIGTFAEFFHKQAAHARTMAASLHAAGERGSLLKLATSPAGAWLKQMVLKQAWRDGWPGHLAAASTAAAALMKHAVLIELSRRPPPRP